MKIHQYHPIAQELLGCAWGRKVWTLDDTSLCDDAAIQIVILHDGPSKQFDVRLCQRHLEAISRETTPHEFNEEREEGS